MSMVTGDTNKSIYITPSGVFKERLHPDDLVSFDWPDPQLAQPFHLSPHLKSSTCFFAIHKQTGAGCCVHTHSQNAVLAAASTSGDTFKITDQEMIKGIRKGGVGRALANTDTLEIPIIPNQSTESELTAGISEAISRYPDAPCVLIKNHGVYLWAENLTKAKVAAECLDYLFEISWKLRAR